MLGQENNISPEDMYLFKVVDTAEEAVAIVDDFYSRHMMQPNF